MRVPTWLCCVHLRTLIRYTFRRYFISIAKMSSAHPRARLASLRGGDLVCWNCGHELIGGYVELLAASGPVSFFGVMTLACAGCSSLNRSPAGSMTGTTLAPV